METPKVDNITTATRHLRHAKASPEHSQRDVLASSRQLTLDSARVTDELYIRD